MTFLNVLKQTKAAMEPHLIPELDVTLLRLLLFPAASLISILLHNKPMHRCDLAY